MRLVNVHAMLVDRDFVHVSQAVGTGIEVSPALEGRTRKEGCTAGSAVLRESLFHHLLNWVT
jgi:hypothetical protein